MNRTASSSLTHRLTSSCSTPHSSGNSERIGDPPTAARISEAYPNAGFADEVFGTSAAAPHAGAVAALLLEAKSKFEINIGNQPANRWVKEILQESASNNGSYNRVSGYGFISAINAIDDFANPTPFLKKLNLENLTSGQEPGDEAFELIIVGEYFSDSTVVFFRDEI